MSAGISSHSPNKGLWDSISSFFGGSPDKFYNINTKTQGQQQGLDQILSMMKGMTGPGGNYSQAQDYYGRLLNNDKDTYDRFAAPYMQKFEQQTIPMLAERFAGMGGGLGGGALGSSGFGQAVGGAGSGLQAQLAGLFSNLQRGAAQDTTAQYNQLSNQGLGTQMFENSFQPGSNGLLGELFSSGAGGVGQAGGMIAMMKALQMMGLV